MTGEFPPDAPIERIRRYLVGLRMPRALETLDHLVAQIERGQLGTIEAIEMLLAEELTIRETRRIKAALQMARLSVVKTLSSFDFVFQPSLDRNRILALADLKFICLRHRQEPSRDGTRGRGREGGKERRVRHARGHRHHHFARAPAVPRLRLPPCRRRDRLPPGRTWRGQSVLPVGQRQL
jgi:hypothetical protein